MSSLSRPVTLIDKDLLGVCRHIGAVGLGAELALRPPDVADLTVASQGLAAVLRERRATVAAKEGDQ